MSAGRGIMAGLAGTVVMTMLMLAAPLMGMPPMPIGEMLGGFLGIGTAAGWVVHFAIGGTLGAGYALLFARAFKGPAPARGAAYGVGVFLLAQAVVMPMMGAGFFSGGSVPMIMGSLIGHLAFGAVTGAVAGAPAADPAVAAA